jgi:hypothetical protein
MKAKTKRSSKVKNISIEDKFTKLKAFLEQNRNTDFSKVNLLSVQVTNSFIWNNFEADKEKLIKQLKAYQRLLRVVPQNDIELLLSLMSAGIHASIQIASIPKQKFISTYLSLFNNDLQLIEQTYKRAQFIRSHLLIKHIQNIQNSEPHITNNNKLMLN